MEIPGADSTQLGPRSFNGQRLRDVFAEVPATSSPAEELCAGLGGHALVGPLDIAVCYVYIFTKQYIYIHVLYYV